MSGTGMNVVVAQCGGPTAVINASLAAVVARSQSLPGEGRVWGCRLGMQGLVAGEWRDLTELTPEQLARLRGQPGAALGSSRYRMPEEDVERLLARLQERSVQALLLIGGNGTMAAAHR